LPLCMSFSLKICHYVLVWKLVPIVLMCLNVLVWKSYV
jgi:hypothetical protein